MVTMQTSEVEATLVFLCQGPEILCSYRQLKRATIWKFVLCRIDMAIRRTVIQLSVSRQ
jgi:hypothetical protein